MLHGVGTKYQQPKHGTSCHIISHQLYALKNVFDIILIKEPPLKLELILMNTPFDFQGVFQEGAFIGVQLSKKRI